jgi:hypothetical protein
MDTRQFAWLAVVSLLVFSGCGSSTEPDPGSVPVTSVSTTENLELSLAVTSSSASTTTFLTAETKLTNTGSGTLTFRDQGCAGPVAVALLLDPLPTATTNEQYVLDAVLTTDPERGFSVPFAPSDSLPRCADGGDLFDVGTSTDLGSGESITASYVLDGSGRRDFVVDPGSVEVTANLGTGGIETTVALDQPGANSRMMGPGEALALMMADPAMDGWVSDGLPVGDPNFQLRDGEWQLIMTRLSPLPLRAKIKIDALTGDVTELSL